MIQLSEAESKEICKKFFNQHQWELVTPVNHSKMGLNPLIIIKKDNNTPVIHLYDNYLDLINDIKSEVEKDLNYSGGYSSSFYLSLEDIDNLDLQRFVTTDKDVEKVLSDAKTIINS